MSANDYQLVEHAIRFLDQNVARQPELREVAASVGLSEFHFQRLFLRWAGLSPKRFLQFRTAQEAKRVLRIPAGRITTYAGLAGGIGQPRAARAVGSAVAANRIGYLVPCHRVIRNTGAFGEYRWGPVRKRILLAAELAQARA